MADLRFLHIPKTAGKTFSYILVSEYGPRRTFRLTGDMAEDMAKMERYPEKKRNRISLFICHAPLSCGIKKADSAAMITFLRDPVNRAKSFCQHVYEGKSPHLLHQFPPYSFQAADMLNKNLVELQNLYVNMLVGGNPRLGDSVDKLVLSDDELLDKAWQTLTEKITCFGLTEYFDRSLLVFRRKLCWPAPPFYSRLNRKSRKDRLEFTGRDIETIAEMNRLDIALYERAKEYFLQRTGDISEKDIENFTAENQKRQIATYVKWLVYRILGKMQQ